MILQTAQRPALSLDFKRNRIRIHKSAIRSIGNPDSIQFLVNPQKGMLAIMRSDHSDLRAHRLHWRQLAHGQSFELHSKRLLRRLQGLCAAWQDNRTYRIRGETVPNQGVAVFRVAESVRVGSLR